MIKNIIKAAAELDQAGFHVEADLMDKIMQKVAQELDEDMDEMEEEESDEESDFGFLGSEDEDDSNEEYEEEEESEDDDGEHSVEECLTYCTSFSNADKVELIKALLDSMDH